MVKLVDERPTSPDKIVEALLDPEVRATHFANQGTAESYIGEILKAHTEAHRPDEQVWAKQLGEVFAETMKANGYKPTTDPERTAAEGGKLAGKRFDPPKGMNAGRFAGFGLNSPKAAGHSLNTPFVEKMNGSPGAFMQAAWHLADRLGPETVEARAELAKVTAQYSSEIGSSGGFLIPEQLRSELLMMELEDGVMLGRVTTFPMTTKTLTVPQVDVTSHASSLFGGVITYWVYEAETMTESQAAYAVTKLEANTLTGLARIPNENMADTNHLDAYFSAVFPPAMTFEKDYRFLKGTGVGQPLGMLEAPGRVTVAKESGQAAATVVYENITKMYSRMLPSSKRRAIWVVAPDVMPQLMEMALSVGTGGAPVWLTNATAGPPVTIFGRPVFESEKVPTLGTEGDISFIDPAFYLHGDRQAATMESTPYEKWVQNVTSFKIVERLDGRPWFKSALTPKNGGSTLSPVVTLATRA